MKNHTHIITILVIFMTACSGTNNNELEKKLQELSQLKTELSATAEKIKLLESEIANLDPLNNSENHVKTVSISELNPINFKHYVKLEGNVEAKNNVLVTPKMGGSVVALYVKEGDQVKAGTRIGKIDSKVLTASIEEIKTQLELANTIYQKQKRLWDQNIGTEIQYLQAKNNTEAIRKKLNTLQAQIAQSNMSAPISGIVDEVLVKAGELASPGIGVVRIVNLANLKAIAHMPNSYAASVKVGDEVIIKFPDLETEIKSTLSFVGTIVDPSARTFTVETNIPPVEGLKPNMLAQLQINNASRENALVIDQNLIQTTADGDIVYIANSDGNKKTALAKKVKTGLSYNGKVEIAEGLHAGDQLITLGYQEITDGQLISY